MTDSPAEQAMSVAVAHHQSGRLAEAEIIYRRVLAQNPSHPGALHLLGMVALQAGQVEQAAELIRRAIQVSPEFAEAHGTLGVVLKRQGKLPDAVASFRRAIELNPGNADVFNNMGNALDELGELDEAITAFQRAIELRPDNAAAFSNLGSTLSKQKKFADAVGAFTQAVKLNPNVAKLHMNLGNALRDSGQSEAAMAAYRQAIAMEGDLVEAYGNLAALLNEKREFDRAMDVCRRAIAVRPTCAEAHLNLANALVGNRQLDEAESAYRQAIAIRTGFATAHGNLGVVLKEKGMLDAALAAYRRGMEIDPTDIAIHTNFLYALHFHPAYDAASMAQEHRRWNTVHAEPLRKFASPHANDRNPDRPLRIGYVSPDFRDHVVGRNLVPLFENRDRGQFHSTCYFQSREPDDMTGLFQRLADAWRDVARLDDDELVRQIRADRIDILVDLTLHMSGNRLLAMARKPAPVQATFAGYPGSTGLAAIDYRISDPYLDPPGMDESVYSEKTIRLPASFWCYDPLENRDVAVNALPALQAGVVTFGCLNNFCKINDGVLDVWATVMRRVADSRLMILAPPGTHRQRTLERLSRDGIDPGRVEFVSFLPRRAYLELYHRIDIGLDTFPYTGHTTSLDALWMGTPVVTLVGKTAVGRAGWCQLSNLGLTDLAGGTPERFVSIAVELAGDLPRVAAVRAGLRSRMERSPLMDAEKFARTIEAVYREIWQRWCVGGM
jgi:predicted O-linked N-acetylglucosamine transferase (SPINDLY family)